jgi:alanyl-tRNA synthetase
LQAVLGDHAQQRGSLVAPDRLRFDFAHLRPVAPEELVAIERQVNAWIRQDAAVAWETMPLEDARRTGAMMLFGEKYGDTVRVVSVEGISKELCGGTHLERTGQIGGLSVTDETSVGAGLRRIEAVTGRGAEELARSRQELLSRLAAQVGSQTPEGVEVKVAELVARQRELGREVERLRGELAASRAGGRAAEVATVDGIGVWSGRVSAADQGELRAHVDAMRGQVPEGVIAVGAVIEGSPRVVVAVAPEAAARGLHAGQLVRALAERLGGAGGGRANLAEAGGKDAAALDGALAELPELVRRQLRDTTVGATG